MDDFFSEPPSKFLQTNADKGYVGLHIGQGVPVLDRDLNLLQDLLHKMVRDVVSNYIGDVVIADGDGFKIAATDPASNNFVIRSGKCRAGLFEISSPESETITYMGQQLPSGGNRAAFPAQQKLIVYLDVWLDSVPITSDLYDDIGVVTSKRLIPKWLVKIGEEFVIPEPTEGHTHHRLAIIGRPAEGAHISNDMITDLRQVRRLMGYRPRIIPNQDGEEFYPTKGVHPTPVTISGEGFTQCGEPTVFFGDKPASLSRSDDTEIVAIVPKELPEDRPVKIKVVTGWGEATSRNEFTPQVPRITAAQRRQR